MSGAHFRSRGPGQEVFRNVCWLLDSAKSNHWNLYRLASLIYQPDCYRSYGCARQPACRTTEAGLPAVYVDTQCGVGVGDHESVGSGLFGGLRSKSNGVNIGRELYPERALRSGSCGGYYRARECGVSTIFDPTSLHIGAGDVEFVGGEALGVFQGAEDLYVVGGAVAEDVGDDGGIEAAEFGEFFGHE